MAGIFLSHSSKDKPLVLRLASDLVYEGFPVWLDSWELELGDSFVERIFRELDASTFLIVAITPDSIASEWVRRELETALAREKELGRKLVLPIKLAPCVLPGTIAHRLYADFTSGYLPGLESLAGVLRKLGAAEVEVPLERQLIPLRFTRGINLQETALQARYDALLPRVRQGGQVIPEQFVVIPDPDYDAMRHGFTAFVENFASHPHFSAEREEHFNERYRWIRKGEQALLTGMAAIGNGVQNAFFSMTCHWFARILRNELLAMMDEARAFRGDPPLPNIEPIRGVLNFDDLAAKFYGVPRVTPFDVFHRESGQYIRVWLATDSEIGQWFATRPQMPTELRAFWSPNLMYK